MTTSSDPPRRVVRVKLCCVARVATRLGDHWVTTTRDISALGCQVDAPAAVEPGTRLAIELRDERGPGFTALGHVAWCSCDPPFRVGISFDEPSVPAAVAFFERLVAVHPELAALTPAPRDHGGSWVPRVVRFP